MIKNIAAKILIEKKQNKKIIILKKNTSGAFLVAQCKKKNLPASGRDEVSIPDLGGTHMPQNN